MPRMRLRKLDFQDFPPPRFQNERELPGPADWKLWQRGETVWEDQLELPLTREDARHYAEGLVFPEGDLFFELLAPETIDLKRLLAPLVRPLPCPPFRLACAHRRPGPHRVRIGHALRRLPPAEMDHRTVLRTWGPATSRWSAELREAWGRMGTSPVPQGPVELVLGWRCQSLQSWVELWGPTGDSLGPMLGERGDRPRLERVQRLELNLNLDDRLGMAVDVGVWWTASRS